MSACVYVCVYRSRGQGLSEYRGVWIGNQIYWAVETRNYNCGTVANSHTHKHTHCCSLQHALYLVTLLCLHWLSPSNGSQHCLLLTFHVPLTYYSSWLQTVAIVSLLAMSVLHRLLLASTHFCLACILLMASAWTQQRIPLPTISLSMCA
jgi:hypothetical protein